MRLRLILQRATVFVYKLQLGKDNHVACYHEFICMCMKWNALSSKTSMGISYQYNMGVMALLIRRSYTFKSQWLSSLPVSLVRAPQ